MRDEDAAAAAGVIVHALAWMSEDELAVVAALVRRLERGRMSYGALDVSGDGRSWRLERTEELEDGLVYTLIDEVARARRELGEAGRVGQ